MVFSSRKRDKLPLITRFGRRLSTNGNNGDNEDDDTVLPPFNEHDDTGNDISVPDANTSSITQSAQPPPCSVIIIL